MIRAFAAGCVLAAALLTTVTLAVPCWPPSDTCIIPVGTEVVIHEYPPGDFNGDGAVSLADVGLTLAHVGERYTGPAQADWNRDGAASLRDVAIVLANVGPPPTALPALTDTPTPDFGLTPPPLETETPTAVPTATDTPTP